jgi:hypothetical protein
MLGELPVFEQVGALPRAFIVHDVIGAADAVESLRLIGQPEIDFGVTAVVQTQPDTQCVIEPGEPGQDVVSITRYTPDEVVLQVEAQSTGWLVLADLYYPGWAAEVNGRSVPIQPTNYGLRGICVPEGSHEIRFCVPTPDFAGGDDGVGNGRCPAAHHPPYPGRYSPPPSWTRYVKNPIRQLRRLRRLRRKIGVIGIIGG